MNATQLELMRLIVAYTCIGVFVATSVAVVLNLYGALPLQADIRRKLHATLLLEIVGVCVALFSGLINLNPAPVVNKVEKLQEQTRPRVFVYISEENQRAGMINLQKELQAIGFTSTGIERVTNKEAIPKRPNVRYFNDEDAERAELVVQKLKSAGFSEAFKYRVRDLQAKTGTLEIWLASKEQGALP